MVVWVVFVSVVNFRFVSVGVNVVVSQCCWRGYYKFMILSLYC